MLQPPAAMDDSWPTHRRLPVLRRMLMRAGRTRGSRQGWAVFAMATDCPVLLPCTEESHGIDRATTLRPRRKHG